MRSEFETGLMKSLINHPTSMIFVLRQGESLILMRFKCKTMYFKDPKLNIFSVLAQSLLGVDIKDEFTSPMEMEFPKCLRCPSLLEQISNATGGDNVDDVEVVGAWSRDALRYRVPTSNTVYIQRPAGTFSKN